MENYLLQLALDETKFHPNSQAPAIAGTALASIAEHYRRALNSIKRLSRYYPNLILEFY